MKPRPTCPLEQLASAYLSQAIMHVLTLLRLCPSVHRAMFRKGLLAMLAALGTLSADQLGDEATVMAVLRMLDAELETRAREVRDLRRDGPSQAYPSEGT